MIQFPIMVVFQKSPVIICIVSLVGISTFLGVIGVGQFHRWFDPWMIDGYKFRMRNVIPTNDWRNELRRTNHSGDDTDQTITIVIHQGTLLSMPYDNDIIYSVHDDAYGITIKTDRPKVLILDRINIPLHFRTTTIGQEILTFCHQLTSERQLQVVYVTHLINEQSIHLLKICQELDYIPCRPFGMLKFVNRSKN